MRPHDLLLTANVPVHPRKGVTLTLVTVLEAHVTAADGTHGNELICVLDVRRGSETQRITLTRHSLSPSPPAAQDVLGTRLVLLSVDAYHQPATATVLLDP